MSDLAPKSTIASIDELSKARCRMSAELLVCGDQLTIETVSRVLGVPPPRVECAAGVATWVLSSEMHVESPELHSHLDWLFSQLLRRSEALARLRGERGVKMGVVCNWAESESPGDVVLLPGHMLALADLGLECAFNIAFDESDEDLCAVRDEAESGGARISTGEEG